MFTIIPKPIGYQPKSKTKSIEEDDFAKRMSKLIDIFEAEEKIDYILMGKFEMKRLEKYFDNHRRKRKFAVVERDGEIIPMSYVEGIHNAVEAKVTFQTEEVIGKTYKGYKVVPIDEEFHFEPIAK